MEVITICLIVAIAGIACLFVLHHKTMLDRDGNISTKLAQITNNFKELSQKYTTLFDEMDNYKIKNYQKEAEIKVLRIRFEADKQILEERLRSEVTNLKIENQLKIEMLDLSNKRIIESMKEEVERYELKIAEVNTERELLKQTVIRYNLNIYEDDHNLVAQINIWRQKLKNSNINAVVKELENHLRGGSYHYEIVSLSQRYEDVKSRENSKTISYEEGTIERNKIIKSIFDLLNKIDIK